MKNSTLEGNITVFKSLAMLKIVHLALINYERINQNTKEKYLEKYLILKKCRYIIKNNNLAMFLD